jgi:flagellar motor switch protein FliG
MTPAKSKSKEPGLPALPPPQEKALTVPDPRAQQFSPMQKAAIVMVSLGRQAGSQLLRQLSDDEVEMVSREIARLPQVPADVAESILQEFHQTYLARNYVLEGGMEYARNMLTEAFGADAGTSIAERLLNSLGADAADLVALQKSDPRQLAKLIYNEHPQVIALVLSHLVPVQAAALLNALPGELRAEVAKRMAQLEQFSPEIVEKIASFISRRLKALGEVSRQSYGGVRAVAEMLNRLEKTASDELLNTVAKENEPLSETIRQLMFVFEDVRKLGKQDMLVLLPRIDRKSLPLALKGASDTLKEHFSGCMSQRSAEMLKEDIEALGPVRIKDIETAQGAIISVVRQLQTEGLIGSQGDGDKYID